MTTARPAAGRLDRALDSVPPAAGAEVMGTGIVSIALSLDGAETLSRILLAITALTWVALAVLAPLRIRREKTRAIADIRAPAALTSVAGTGVLGARLLMLGWTWAGIAALVIGLVIWAVLLGPVLGHLTTPTVGVSLMLTVSTESLAVLAAMIATTEHASWLLVAALVPFALGLVLYVFVIARLDLRELAVGHGDHWITGGALAITTLAAGKLLSGSRALAILGDGGGFLKYLALVLWVLSMLWLPVLVAGELLHPRMEYEVRRWSTVFPFGMYAACSFAVGEAAPAGAITTFAQVWVWVALAVWSAVLVATIRRGALA